MNLYQALNQSYRDFKNNELRTLKESEDDKKCNIEDIDEEAKGLEDQLKQTTDLKEKKEIQERLKELKSQAEKCNESDSKEVKESNLYVYTDPEAAALDDPELAIDPKDLKPYGLKEIGPGQLLGTKSNIRKFMDEYLQFDDIDLCMKEMVKPYKESDSKEVKEAETTIEVPVKVEVAGTEVVNPEVTPEAPVEEVTEETTDEIIDDSEKANFDKAISLLNEVLEIINVEGSIDTELCKNKIQNAISTLNTHAEDDDFIEGENCEDCKEGEDKECDTIKEAEVKSFKVTRIAPSKNAFMIEAETTEGLKYFIGKNYDKESHTLDEAEEFTDKAKASDHFKSLLK